EMTVERVVTASGECHVTGVGYRPDGRVEHEGVPLREGPLWTEVVWVLGGGALASNAALRRDADGRWSADGDPTDIAFVVAERKLGRAEPPSEGLSRIGEIPFTSERRMMTALYPDPQARGGTLVVSKGAPDALLARCTGIQVGDEVAPLDEGWRERVLADVDRLSAQAYRVIAVAYRRHPPGAGPPPADASVERDLVYAGTVGIIDPPRPDGRRPGAGGAGRAGPDRCGAQPAGRVRPGGGGAPHQRLRPGGARGQAGHRGRAAGRRRGRRDDR